MNDNPGHEIERAVQHCLDLAETWLEWDGEEFATEDGERIYTPNKVIRRIGDHLVDHLAEVEALLAGVPTQPDAWGASMVTLDTDRSHFSEADLAEAVERLSRLARTFSLRLAAAGQAEWDRPRDPNWTLREIAVHVAEVRWYADQIGRL